MQQAARLKVRANLTEKWVYELPAARAYLAFAREFQLSNLIITVISIALVAVMAAAGLYYGGEAFMDAQAKAQANEIVKAFEQANAALQLYNADNGTEWKVNGWNSLDFLVPRYLSSIPFPKAATKMPTSVCNGSGLCMFYGGGAQYSPVMYVKIDAKNINVCKQIEALRTGTVPETITDWTWYNFIPGARLACMYDTALMFNGWDHFYIAYYGIYRAPK